MSRRRPWKGILRDVLSTIPEEGLRALREALDEQARADPRPAPRCPKCGGEVGQGYGLMGGDIGPYTFCVADGCDYFDKRQDSEAAPESPAPRCTCAYGRVDSWHTGTQGHDPACPAAKREGGGR